MTAHNGAAEGADLSASFAEGIRAYRAAMGMSQARFAEFMKEQGHNWRQTTVCRVESGEQPVTLREAATLSGVFGMPAFRPDSAAAVRHERSMRRMREWTDAYVDRYMLGVASPCQTLAARSGINHSSVRTWIHRARAAGFQTSLAAHEPRAVPWGPERSWTACTACHVEWPCQPVIDWRAAQAEKAGAR